MYYYSAMQANFETEKNRKALTYTSIVCVALLLLFLAIRWKPAPPPQPVPEDLIEVNLGNDMEGMGEEQPRIKGEMSEDQHPVPTPPQSNEAVEEPAKSIDADENETADAAPVKKIEKNESKKPETPKAVTPKTNKPNVASNTPPAPKPQKPKNVYTGPGKGGGNNADVDNGYRNQGNNPNGTGDKGSPKGNPDSYGNSPGGKTGVSVVKGASPLNMGALRFQDDFNENAKVYVEIRYNSAGAYTGCSIVKPTTTTNGTILSIAKRKAAELKFPASADGGISTILFNFKVQN